MTHSTDIRSGPRHRDPASPRSSRGRRPIVGLALLLSSSLLVGQAPAFAFASTASAATTATTTTLDVPAGTQYGAFTVTGHVRPAPAPVDGFIPAVSFLVDGSPSGSAPLDDAGDGSTSLWLPVGTHSIVASFGPFGDYDASQSDPASVRVGIATQVAMTSSRNPVLAAQSIRFTATVSPDAVTGGTLSIVDAFDGSTLASGVVGAGTTSVSADLTLAVGVHELTASFTGSGDYGPSDTHLTQTVNPDTFVDVTGLRVTYPTFYPYKDGYRDTEGVRGTLHEPASVLIRVYSPTNALVKTFNLGSRAAGAYSIVWTGRNASGAILANGTYRIVQRLTDAQSNVKTVTHSVTLSRKRLIWTTSAIARAGYQYSAYADPGNGYVSASRSSYYHGVKLSSGSAGVAVRYTFKVRSAVVYGTSIKFQVLGRSPNGRTVLEGLWNRAYCSPSNVGCYDVTSIGPGYAWWSTSASTGLHVDAQTAYGMVWARYTGVVRTFDIAKVRLIYRWAVLG
jgi:hypothetical protein